MDLLDSIYYGSSLKQWVAFASSTLLVLFALELFKSFLSGRLSKQAGDYVGLARDILKATNFFFIVFFSFYAGSFFLNIAPNYSVGLGKAAVLVLLIQSAIWGSRVIAFWTGREAEKRIDQKETSEATTIAALGMMAKLVLWSVIVLLALENLGVDISALIAGLGIGGIAVALALQNVLGDLFASLSIAFDKPFVIGDFIIIGDYMGTVEHIGLKSTRIKSLSGEQIVFSNNDLLNSRIRNYKKMNDRRVVFSLQLTYDTGAEKLKIIPQILKEITESQNGTRFDRAHFKKFGEWSLDFEIVYIVTNPDYNFYMDVQQAINLAIYERFAKEGIAFAYPTKTVYMEKEKT
ncbi:MAG: mechanosensitive ion channel family protein [Nitrospinota bacterium]